MFAQLSTPAGWLEYVVAGTPYLLALLALCVAGAARGGRSGGR